MNAHNEQHDSASPVVKQNLTTQPAAAQEAVGWQWRWLDTDNTWSEWVDGGSRKEIDARIARWKADGEDHRMQVRPLFAAPVTAAPVCLACEGRPAGTNIPCAVCKRTPAAPADAEEDAYVIDQMGRLLAEIAVIVNGPEPAGTRWSYHDLPAKVKALAITPAAPAVAYMVDGRVERGLTFDKAAAETMALANGGTVRPLVFAGCANAAPADTWFADQLTAMGEVIPLDSTPAAPGIDLAEYDAGLLSDFGGGDIGWWQDYIRAELARAHEFYQSQIEASTKAAAPAIQVPAGWALVRTEPTVEMLDAGINEIDYDGNEVADNVRNVWLAMIEAARKDSPKGAASPEGGCNWPDCGHDTNGVGYSPGCTGIGCHKGSPKDGSEEAGLLSAAKDFYNCTVADPAVRISCSTKERRDRVKALGERLRDELKAAQAGDAEVQP